MSRNSRKRRPKAHAQQAHAIRRALERFDIDLTTDDIDNIVSQIQSNTARHIDDTSNRVGRFLVLLPPDDVPAVACYDRHRKTITTFLLPGMVPGAEEQLR